MNVKKINEKAKETGDRLLGYHTIHLPVYLVFLQYESIDNDPFYPVQKFILQYMDGISNKDVNTKLLASLIGLNEQIVKQQIVELKKKSFIIPDPNDGFPTVSDDAKRKYFNVGSRPYKSITGRIIVDGISFSLLPHDYYEAMGEENEILVCTYDNDNMVPHTPIPMSLQDEKVVELETALNNPKCKKERLGLEEAGRTFKVISVEKKFLKPVHLVYFLKKNGRIRKVPYLGDNEVNSTKAMSNIEDFRFQLSRHGLTINYGYGNSDKSKTQYVEVTDEIGWLELIKEKYKLSKDFELNPVAYDNELNEYFIHVDENLLKHSGSPRDIMIDCLKATPVAEFKDRNGRGRLFVNIRVAEDMDGYLDVYKLVNHDGGNVANKLDDFDNLPDGWRSKMFTLKFLSELEMIDCKKYIHSL